MLLPLLLASTVCAGPLTTARPTDTGAALRNPGVGWVLHYYDNIPTNYGSRLAPSDTVDEFPGLSVVYLRIPWSYVQPAEDVFCWSVLDAPLQRWKAVGVQAAFRISCSESWMRWATPEWVHEAGAQGYNFTPGREDPDGPYWEPDYDDPVFLEKLEAFLAAFAARYDGDPDVAFVDVGSYGVWGEGHLWASTGRTYPPSTLIRHIDLHRKYFTRTLLVANDDWGGQGEGIIEHAQAAGLGLRDDSIMVQPPPNSYFNGAMAQAFWPTVPTILESEHYGPSVERGAWGDGSKYIEAMEEYHASLASIHWWPDEFLAECRPLIDAMNLRLGYRLLPVEVSWPESLTIGEALPLTWSWRNAGVAPCYAGGWPAITLTDAAGGLAAVYVDEGLDVGALPVGAPGEVLPVESSASFAPAFNLAAGRYDVWVSVGDRFGTPRYELALPDGQAKRYRLGSLQIRGDYDVRIGELRAQGDGWQLPVDWTLYEPQPGTSPFGHFDGADGQIAHATGWDEARGALFAAGGPASVPLWFTVPEAMRGQSFEFYIGLFRPARLGQADERLWPDRGRPDRRVHVGRVEIDAAGGVTLTRAAD